jgi:hypothetical protein
MTKPLTGAFVDQVLDLQAAERLAFAELFEPGDGLADLLRTTGHHRHEPSNGSAVSSNRDLFSGRYPFQETRQVRLGFEGAYRVHSSVQTRR